MNFGGEEEERMKDKQDADYELFLKLNTTLVLVYRSLKLIYIAVQLAN